MTTRPGLAVAMGEWSARHRKSAVFGWLLFVVLASTLGTMAGTDKTTAVQNGVGESGRAAKILDTAGIQQPAAESVLIQSKTFTASDPKFNSAVSDAVAAVSATGQVSDAHSPYESGAISADRHSALIDFTMKGDPDTAADRVQPVLDAVAKTQQSHKDLRIEEFGEAGGAKNFGDVFTKDFGRAEYSAVPLALGILLVAFGALMAAVLPVVLAVTAFVGAFGLMALSSHVLPTDDNAASIMLLVGLAVGVDYCLFYLRRQREERAAGRDIASAVRIAAATSGHSVLVSGLTVVVALAGMFLTGIATFKAMGVAAILVVVVAVLGALTVLPAALSMLGDGVAKGRIPLIGKRREQAGEGSRFWRAVLTPVLGRPAVWAVGGTLALLALASPLVGMHTAQLTAAQELPRDNPVVLTQARIEQAFPGSPQPARVVVKAADVRGAAMAKAIGDLKNQALATRQIFGPVRVKLHAQQNVAIIDMSLAGTGTDSKSERALQTLRSIVPRTVGAVSGAEAAVTGTTAMSVDFSHRLGSSALPVFGFVLVLCFLLMLMSFRSVVVALTAVVLNLLSVGAAYGVLTLVFQHGVGASLLGTYKVGAIASWMPLFLFVILFGLSMDYHVFVVSRIKEGHDKGLSTRDAIAGGIAGTAGVVTSAAVIMVGVFAIFGTLSVMSMKQIGVGLSVAVLIDATVIRAVLLPAVMATLGDRNWIMPRWLGGLPDLSHREVSAEGVPAATVDPGPMQPSRV